MGSDGSTKGVDALPAIAAHESARHDVIRVLRRAILSGAFAPGERLSLNRLANQLGVSVMPVREALVSLANEGLVETEANRRGFRATPLERQDVDDVYELHAYISGLLAHRAARVITDKDVDALKDIHREFCEVAETLDTTVTHQALEDLNDQFHRRLNAIAQGTRLKWFLRLTSRLTGYVNVEGWCGATLNDHPKIIAALETRDAERAARLVEDHFRQGVTLLRASPSR